MKPQAHAVLSRRPALPAYPWASPGQGLSAEALRHEGREQGPAAADCAAQPLCPLAVPGARPCTHRRGSHVSWHGLQWLQKPVEKALERGGGRQGTCRASGGSAVSPQAGGPPQTRWPFPKCWGLGALPWEASGLLVWGFLRTQRCVVTSSLGALMLPAWCPGEALGARMCHDPCMGPDYPTLHPPALVGLLSLPLVPTLVCPGHRTLPVPQPGRLTRTSCPRALRAEKGGRGPGAHQEEGGKASCGTYVSGSLGHQSPPQMCTPARLWAPATSRAVHARQLLARHTPGPPPLSPGPPPPSPHGPLEGSCSRAVPRRTFSFI